MVSIEKGLDPLAVAMLELNDKDFEAKAAEFIKTDNEDSALNVATVDEAITGAKDIVAERVSQDT